MPFRRTLLSLVTAILFVCLCLGSLSTVSADTIFLHTGGRVDGEIISEDSVEVKIKTKVGVITVSWDKIARIERVEDPASEFESRFQKLEKRRRSKAEEYYRLGVWAEEQRLEEQAKKAFERAIEKNPDHAEAHEKLGHVRYAGEWMTPEEKYRAQGLVKYKDRWVTPEEKTNLEQGLVKVGDIWVSKEKAEALQEEGLAANLPDYAKEGVEEEDGEDASEAEELDPEEARRRKEYKKRLLAQQLKQQKKLAREAEERLGLDFQDFENKDMLIHTTQPTDSERFQQLLRDLKTLYKTQSRIYAIKKSERIWPGKLQIFFFKNKSQFDAFATRIDNAAGAVQSGGYFIEGYGPGGSKLHITMYNVSLGTLAHEMSHAFMSRYNDSGVRATPWLNEGTAEYMRYTVILNLQGKEGRHKYTVKQMLIRDDRRLSLSHMMAKKRIRGTEGWAYAVGWSLVDFMIKEGGRNFVEFLREIKKEGAGWRVPSVAQQEEAIEKAFEISPEKFEQLWKAYIRKTY